MKINARDLAKIRLPLLAALALLVGSLLIVSWSNHQAQRATQVRDAAAARKNQIEQRFRQVRTEELDLKERALLFQQLQARDGVGNEKRLEWTELLRSLQNELRLPGMRYEFGPQKALETVSGVAYAWFASPLHLELQLLHEEDLLRVLERIERDAKALVVIQECRLERLTTPPASRDSLAQLKATCDMLWHTARRATGK